MLFYASIDPSTLSRGDVLTELCGHYHPHIQQFAQGICPFFKESRKNECTLR
jgi:hypothetical protein